MCIHTIYYLTCNYLHLLKKQKCAFARHLKGSYTYTQFWVEAVISCAVTMCFSGSNEELDMPQFIDLCEFRCAQLFIELRLTGVGWQSLKFDFYIFVSQEPFNGLCYLASFVQIDFYMQTLTLITTCQIIA